MLLGDTQRSRFRIDPALSLVPLARLPPRPLVAINEQYATLQSELRGGEEVAVIPPVAGG